MAAPSAVIAVEVLVGANAGLDRRAGTAIGQARRADIDALAPAAGRGVVIEAGADTVA